MLPFHVTILGSGSATPVPDRHQTSQILRYDNNLFMLDCGEATQRQLLKYKVRWQKLRAIFISHLHGDHFSGLPALLNTMTMHGRKDPLPLFAPPQLADLLTMYFKAGEVTLDFDLQFVPLQMGKAYRLWETDFMTVDTVPMEHRIPCMGFVFREKITKKKLIKEKTRTLRPKDYQLLQVGKDLVLEDGTHIPNAELTYPDPDPRSYAFCADTRYLESIIPHIKEADLLYHEATFLDEKRAKAHLTFHSTGKQAAQIAQKANVKKLVLGHFSAGLKDLDALLEEARTVFPSSELALEGRTFEI
ncbi:MAG: ribonuclease Z, partial [Bacteroidota bacterium]